MAVDVAPEILEEIEKNFEEYYKDPNVKRIYKKIVDGTATYSDMQILSSLVAKHIYKSTEKAYINALESGKLPNDKLYENIVDKTMRPTLKDGHGLIVEACGDVQTDLNRKSGIKLNAVEPALNINKVDGLIYQIANTNNVRLSTTVLGGLIDTFCRSIVDDYVHANLEFQRESGLRPQISRTRGANSNSKCEYCAALVYTGDYKGPGMPAEIFRRHRYCHCNVLYNPMDGNKIQDVWSKREYQDYKEAQQKQRQYLAELDKMTPAERKLARNARARALRRAKYTPEEWSRRKVLEKINAERAASTGLSLEERKAYRGLVVDNRNNSDIIKQMRGPLQLPSPKQLEFIIEIEQFPKLLGTFRSPKQLYDELVERGFEVKPLGRGKYKGVPFEEGGGFRVNYRGDGILQYHPKKGSRHGGEYYKIGNGRHGIKRYTIEGNEYVGEPFKHNGE